MNADLLAKIANWRARTAGIGEPMTQEEYREAIQLVREGRISAQTASTAKKAGTKKAIVPNADDMLRDMLGSGS